jgi:hypothetical protein
MNAFCAWCNAQLVSDYNMSGDLFVEPCDSCLDNEHNLGYDIAKDDYCSTPDTPQDERTSTDTLRLSPLEP